MGLDVVLRVAEVDEGEGAGASLRGAKMIPLGPVGAVADAVSVQGVGGEAGEVDGVVMGGAEIGGEVFGAGREISGG
jgi:hypothetical protein